LGLADFRLQSFEAIDKWFAVTLVSINYLQYQQAQSYVETGKLPVWRISSPTSLDPLETVIRRIAEEACNGQSRGGAATAFAVGCLGCGLEA